MRPMSFLYSTSSHGPRFLSLILSFLMLSMQQQHVRLMGIWLQDIYHISRMALDFMENRTFAPASSIYRFFPGRMPLFLHGRLPAAANTAPPDMPRPTKSHDSSRSIRFSKTLYLLCAATTAVFTRGHHLS